MHGRALSVLIHHVESVSWWDGFACLMANILATLFVCGRSVICVYWESNIKVILRRLRVAKRHNDGGWMAA